MVDVLLVHGGAFLDSYASYRASVKYEIGKYDFFKYEKHKKSESPAKMASPRRPASALLDVLECETERICRLVCATPALRERVVFEPRALGGDGAPICQSSPPAFKLAFS